MRPFFVFGRSSSSSFVGHQPIEQSKSKKKRRKTKTKRECFVSLSPFFARQLFPSTKRSLGCARPESLERKGGKWREREAFFFGGKRKKTWLDRSQKADASFFFFSFFFFSSSSTSRLLSFPDAAFLVGPPCLNVPLPIVIVVAIVHNRLCCAISLSERKRTQITRSPFLFSSYPPPKTQKTTKKTNQKNKNKKKQPPTRPRPWRVAHPARRGLGQARPGNGRRLRGGR